jgi:hypothetical protein
MNGRPNGANALPNARNDQHLREWMDRHGNLPIDQKLRALDNEPGFRELPAQTQQKMRDELVRLNNMPAAARNQRIAENERLEQLSEAQRQQVRSTIGQLTQQMGGLPPDRQRAVKRAFRDLRTLPPNQRQQYMNSPAYRAQFSDPERNMLGRLMTVEPYIGGRPGESTQ